MRRAVPGSEAGVGKTEIGKVIAQGLGRELILQLMTSAGCLRVELLAADDRNPAGGSSRGEVKGEARADIYSEKFLIKRPLARRWKAFAVLLIDELDRADEPFEAYLLEVLSTGRSRFRVRHARASTADRGHHLSRSRESDRSALPWTALGWLSDAAGANLDLLAQAPKVAGRARASRVVVRSVRGGVMTTIGGSEARSVPTSGIVICQSDSTRAGGPKARRAVELVDEQDGEWPSSAAPEVLDQEFLGVHIGGRASPLTSPGCSASRFRSSAASSPLVGSLRDVQALVALQRITPGPGPGR